MLDKEGNNIDAVIVATPGSHARHRGHVVHGARQARLRAEAARSHGLGSAPADGGGHQVQGRHPDGQPGLLATKARGRPPRSSGTARSATSPKSTPGPTGRCGRRASRRSRKEEPVPSTLDWDLWLGIAEKRPFAAAAAIQPDRNGGFFYQPFNWRGFYDFGCGALGDMACHILGAPNMALHLSNRAVTSVECVSKEGTSPFMFPKDSVTRFDFAAYGNMPPLKLFWYDGREGESQRSPGVPEGELIGDPPSATRPAGAARRQAADRAAATARARHRAARPGRRRADRAAAEWGWAAAALQRIPVSWPRIQLEEFEPSRPRPREQLRFPQPTAACFIGDKGMLTTGTYGDDTRLIPSRR